MNNITVNKRKDPFVRVDRNLAQDDQLSFAARGLMAYALSLPADWKLNLSDLSNRSPQGKSAVRSMINELLKFGYMTRKRVQGERGKMAGYDYTLHEWPAVVRFSDDGLPDDGKPHTNIEDSIDKKHKDKKHLGGEVGKREPKTEEIKTVYDHSEADNIDDAFSPSPEKEKSSAKKENDQDGPLTPETAQRRDEFLSRQRAASVRTLGSTPPTPDEPAQAASPARIHDMTNSILKDLETEWGQRQLQIARARARIGDAKCENMYAAVYRYYEHNCIEQGRPIRTDIIPNLGGYIRNQINKETRQRQTSNTSRYAKSTSNRNPDDNPKHIDYSDPAVWG